MPQITFLPDNRTILVENGVTILEAARRTGVLIEAPCNGAGHCGKCRVLLPAGDLIKLAVHQDIADYGSADNSVLACHAEIHGDLTITVPRQQEEGLRVISSGDSVKVVLEPFIVRRYDAVANQTAVFAGDRVLALEPGNSLAHHAGLVVDLGTTTLVVALIDLHSGSTLAERSALNPQSLHAQDVLSRIRLAADENGLALLQQGLITELNRLIRELSEESGVATEQIFEAVISGNTCMLHLLAGVDPTPLGKHPFTPSISGNSHLDAAQIGLALAPTALVYLPPVISAYVGADISAGLLASDLSGLSGTTLFIDIGTNGELALARNGSLITSATAAGPAFEGMNITCGMRAAIGAIERVSVAADGSLEIGVIGDAPPTGICGSGLMDLVAELIEQGIIGRSGRLTAPAGHPLADRVVRLDTGSTFRLQAEIHLSQKDIRQVQLAKGAIRAGIELLLQEAGVTAADLDRVLIAGSFGYHLREKSLLTLGLLPPEAAGKVSFSGNTSRSGGEMLLLNQHLRQRLRQTVQQVKVVDLAGNPAFERVFVEAMGF